MVKSEGSVARKLGFEFWFQQFLTQRGLPSYLHTVCLFFLILTKGFPGGSAGRESAAMWETRSLGREDPLEKGMATHFSILAWRIPCVAHGVAKSRT